MTPETITWIWIIAGIVVMILELLFPGLIIVFFGAGAVAARKIAQLFKAGATITVIAPEISPSVLNLKKDHNFEVVEE